VFQVFFFSKYLDFLCDQTACILSVPSKISFLLLWFYIHLVPSVSMFHCCISGVLIPVAARSKAWSVAARLLGFGFESRRGHGCLSVVSVVCWQVEVSASGWSLVKRSPTDCGVSECDREASIMRRPWPTRGCCAIKKYSRVAIAKCFYWFVILHNVAVSSSVYTCNVKRFDDSEYRRDVK
jgi:hypothetical protein